MPIQPASRVKPLVRPLARVMFYPMDSLSNGSRVAGTRFSASDQKPVGLLEW